MQENKKLLIKLNFINDNNMFFIIDSFYKNMSDLNNNILLLSINNDIIINDFIENKLKSYKNLLYFKTLYKNKVDFLNSNINKIDNWDILLSPIYLINPIIKDFDTIIKNKISNDILWIFDGKQKDLITIPVIKKNYYIKNNYIFNPLYKENYFINEFTDICRLKNNYNFFNKKLFEKNQLDEDKFIYVKRKNYIFGLSDVLKNKIKNDEINNIINIDNNIHNDNNIDNEIDEINNIINIDNEIDKNTKINKNVKFENNPFNLINNYLKNNINFLIYKNNILIFDSKSNKQNIKIYKNYFDIYGKKFDYNNIKIKNRI